MPTYAVITAADRDQVRAALLRTKVGGYLHTGEGPGSAVLFDRPKPRFGRISRSRILDPAWELAGATKAGAWLLEDDGQCAQVTACYPTGGYLSLGWAAEWTPPEDPARLAAHLRLWRKDCAEIARKTGLSDPDALAEVRNDPAPDGSRIAGEDILRRICALVGAPDLVVGQSLFEQAGPRGRDFERFEARGR
ncbi:hypothetical protein ACIRBX_13440 [Kitasatospora sp. NPDC096147]|uniref:hypothetical protein n=1 Tax=Kitasatospora sp. NPDC096147 TaxID=3364093 RepID=UPI0038080668